MPVAVADPRMAKDLCQDLGDDGLPSLETKDGGAAEGSERASLSLLRVPKSQGSQRPLQASTMFGSFLSNKGREILGESETMDVDKLDRLAIRAISVGLVNPTEQTFGHLVAVGMATGVQGQN